MSADLVWTTLRAEAQAAAVKEPVLSGLLHESILHYGSLECALAYRISRKLGHDVVSEPSLQELFEEAFAGNPVIGAQVREDIQAIHERDPASRGFLSPFLYFKGFQALTAYRLAHHLWNQDRHEIALHLQSSISEVCGVDIHPAAQIGAGILFDHATSIVIGETAVVEDHVSILHEVTLGGTGKARGRRHPHVCRGVLIGAGAKLLGDIKIGECAKIGAGSVVLEDVNAHTTVVGVPAREVGLAPEDPAGCMEHALKVYAQSASLER
ncbi:serine O-acetyltransferase [Synoicihabitans lomoniglobus]|uniref:Serine acetyltransferase n=1 Tax=Synoicihabitans lomoniglobus TaxID=2909285 RepID=A0AAE9ZZM2_9BACT|nr:serine O-acetyltransferase [Opitutaceae bacterium LMO-M01]WED64363.1 serine O-acetyltransferase [Opitutaceae bacterium LMO-M01]